jgi:hypothetical protein
VLLGLGLFDDSHPLQALALPAPAPNTPARLTEQTKQMPKGLVNAIEIQRHKNENPDKSIKKCAYWVAVTCLDLKHCDAQDQVDTLRKAYERYKSDDCIPYPLPPPPV